LSEEKKYRNYTVIDIEKYHRGLLSPKEMNELERAALEDPFLADALEGYGTTSVNAAADLSELEKKLQERISRAKVISIVSRRNSFKWWKVAAVIIIIGGLGFFTLRLSTNIRNKPVAELEEKKSIVPAAKPISDSNKLNIRETTDVASVKKPLNTIKTTSKEKKEALSLSEASDSNNVAAVATTPEALTNSYYKKESKDSIIPNGYSIGSRDVSAKKAEPGNRQLEELAAFKQKGMVLEQRKMNFFRGRVVDANNNPLPFANITNTRDNVGTYADVRGNFTLISPDSILDVQVRSVGFINDFTRLRNSVTMNQVILQDDKTAPDRIISYQKPDTSRSRKANMKFEEPEPADGWTNYSTYLANNIKLPDDLIKKPSADGQVQLSFEVNQNGDPVDIKVERSLCRKCDQEAIRLIKEGPKWKKKNKKTKRVVVTVPFDGSY